MSDRNIKAVLRHLEEKIEEAKFVSKNLKDDRVGIEDLTFLYDVIDALEVFQGEKENPDGPPTLEELFEFGQKIESDSIKINWGELIHV